MGLIFSASTFAGVGASKLLLTLGLSQVLLRYPLAVIISYGVFLGLTRLWVYWVLSSSLVAFASSRSKQDSDASGFLNGVDFDLTSGNGGGGSNFSGFGGGSSGGGGASDTWASVGDVQPVASGGGGGSSHNWFNFNFDLDLDDDLIWVIILLIVLVTAILGSGVYLIYVAPELLPDLAVNALLASYFARAAKKADDSGWVMSALKSTWLPFVIVLLLTTGLAYTIHRACPSAHRLIDAFSCPA